MPDALRDVAERAVAVVAIEQVRVGGQALRPAVDRNALPQAVGALPGSGAVGEVEAQVVGDEQIEPAVAVVVDERAAGAPARPPVAQPGARGDVLEAAVAALR